MCSSDLFFPRARPSGIMLSRPPETQGASTRPRPRVVFVGGRALDVLPLFVVHHHSLPRRLLLWVPFFFPPPPPQAAARANSGRFGALSPHSVGRVGPDRQAAARWRALRVGLAWAASKRCVRSLREPPPRGNAFCSVPFHTCGMNAMRLEGRPSPQGGRANPRRPAARVRAGPASSGRTACSFSGLSRELDRERDLRAATEATARAALVRGSHEMHQGRGGPAHTPSALPSPSLSPR